MERWAANTLRVLGIVATSLLVLVGGLLLLLLSLCAWGGGFSGARNRGEAVGYLIGLLALLAGGIFAIARLSRGIARSAGLAVSYEGNAPVTEQAGAASSPTSLRAVQHLIYAVVAVVVFVAVRMILDMVLGRSSALLYGRGMVLPRIVAPLLYQAPYLALLVGLARKANRKTFSFALAIPAASILLTFYDVVRVFWFYANAPIQAVLMLAGLGLECLVLWLAWHAAQKAEVRLDAEPLLVAGAAMLAYFGALQFILIPLLYRFRY